MQGRKILFFLGAGASVAAGAYATIQGSGQLKIPTQASFWSTFLRFCRSSNNRKLIESFLFRYFLGYSRVPSRMRPQERREMLNNVDVEEVFTFLSERAGAPSTSDQLRVYVVRVWESLVAEIGTVFGRFPANAATRKNFRALLQSHIRRHDAVVSFNYDTVFEDSLPSSEPWFYEGVESGYSGLRVLKPHGSINWQAGEGIEVADTPTRAVVVAPTHLKFVASAASQSSDGLDGYLDHYTQVRDVWSHMERHMQKSKALVFIGYSFPVADLYFSSILRSVLADRDGSPGIVLVNPDAVAIGERLQNRFYVPTLVRYFDMQQFVQSSRRDLLSLLDA